MFQLIGIVQAGGNDSRLLEYPTLEFITNIVQIKKSKG